MSNFCFEILQKKNFKDIYLKNLNITFQNTHKNNDKKEMKIIHKDYKTYFSNKNIAASKKMKNVSNISKIVKKIDNKKSKDLKDINMFDNDFSYMRNNRLSKYEDSRMLTNSHTKKERTGSISQRKRKIDNKVNNTSVNSNLSKFIKKTFENKIDDELKKYVPNFEKNNENNFLFQIDNSQKVYNQIIKISDYYYIYYSYNYLYDPDHKEIFKRIDWIFQKI